MKRRIHAIFTALALAVTFAVAAPAMACPNCREFLPNESSAAAQGGADGGAPVERMSATDRLPATFEIGASGNAAEGYYYSILLMLAVPSTLAAGLGVGAYYLIRNDRQMLEAQTLAQKPPTPSPLRGEGVVSGEGHSVV